MLWGIGLNRGLLELQKVDRTRVESCRSRWRKEGRAGQGRAGLGRGWREELGTSMSRLINWTIFPYLVVCGFLEAVTIVDHRPNDEYMLDHAVDYDRAIAEARNLQIFPGKLPLAFFPTSYYFLPLSTFYLFYSTLFFSFFIYSHFNFVQLIIDSLNRRNKISKIE